MSKDRENDLLKTKIQYRTWLSGLDAPKLRALAAQVGLRDWLSMSTDDLIANLNGHGKAQTIWATTHGVFDGEAERIATPG